MTSSGYGIGGAGAVPNAETFVDPVEGTRIYLRRSAVQGKKPQTSDAEFGELFVNYHSADPMLCFRDNADNIVEIKPQDPVGSGPMPPGAGNETGDLWWDGTHLLIWNGSAWVIAGAQELSDLSDVDTTGVATNNLLAYDGSKFVPVAPASISVDVDLEYSKQTDKGIVLNSAGDDAELTPVDTIYAGLMLPADKIKLDAIEPGAQANTVDSVFGRTGDVVATEGDYDLGQLGDVDTTGATDGRVLGYTGGAWGPVDPASLSVDVDLGYTPAADKGTVTNTAGDDATLPLATGSNAGLSLNNYTTADKDKLGGIADGAQPGTVTSVDSGDGLSGGPITEAGTLSVQADGGTITVSASGIKVTDDAFVTPGDLATELDDYLLLTGGFMTGGVSQQVRTITVSEWDLEKSNLWEVGGIDIPNPINAMPGMSGVVILMAAPTSWGSNFSFPGGTPVAPDAVPAVVPFYVRGSTEIYIGKAQEGMSDTPPVGP